MFSVVSFLLSQLQEYPPFDMHMAITDTNFWAVIFCGFIAYIIWGLVFNLVMDAYNNLDLTQSRNKHIDDKIKACELKITKVELAKTDLQTKLTEKQDEEKRLQTTTGLDTCCQSVQLDRNIHYDWFVLCNLIEIHMQDIVLDRVELDIL